MYNHIKQGMIRNDRVSKKIYVAYIEDKIREDPLI